MNSSDQSPSSASLSPIILYFFDQYIDPEQVIKFITFSAKKTNFPIKQVTSKSLKKKNITLPKHAEEGKWIAVKPVNPLPHDTQVTVMLTRGVPSTEGPLPGNFEDTFTFTTFPMFAVTST